MATIITDFLSLFQHEFFILAVVAAIFSGFLCGFTGPYLSWRKLGSLGSSISHSALTAIAFAALIGVATGWILFPFSIFLALLLAFLKEKKHNDLDSIVALFYSGFMGIGVLLLSFSGKGSSEMVEVLFGDILVVDRSDIFLLGGLSVALLAFAVWQRKGLILSLVHSDLAIVEGVPTHRLNYISMALIGLSIAASIKILGVILMTSLMMVPTLIASKYTKSIRSHFVLSSLIGVTISFVGILLAAALNLPSGASIAAFAFVLFLVNSVIKR